MTLSPIVLENAFVRLDPLQEQHREPLREAGNDPDLWRFANVNLDNTDFDAWIDNRLGEIAKSGDLTWAVFDKASNSYAGSTSYLAVVLAHKRLEIGWTWYAASRQRSAVNTTAKLLLMQHAFETLGARLVGWRTDNYNFASQRAIERLGARKDGVLRHHALRRDGTVRDTVMYSLAAGEWPEVKAHLLWQLTRPR